jgi:hypothetical protein
MTAARVKRVDRLEEASALRAARAAAVTYGLTAEETAGVVRDTRRALLRWRAGLPIGLDWMLDGATAEIGLTPEERAHLERQLGDHLAHAGDGRRW